MSLCGHLFADQDNDRENDEEAAGSSSGILGDFP